VSLQPGTRLGRCDAAAIGAGGVGEVYQATDTNLKRQVAIKILPDSFAADGDRLARFQREAGRPAGQVGMVRRVSRRRAVRRIGAPISGRSAATTMMVNWMEGGRAH
jgi:serine/threonine protein kinase